VIPVRPSRLRVAQLLAAPPPNIVRLTLLASIVRLPPALDETGEAAEKICRKCANGDDSPAACIDASIDGRKLSACRTSGRPIRPRTCVQSKFVQSSARSFATLGTTADGPIGIIPLVRFGAIGARPIRIDRTIRTAPIGGNRCTNPSSHRRPTRQRRRRRRLL
jgi:hypothetical protein